MANEMQRGNLTGTAIMRIPISGTVNISGKQMKELRFVPYSEFPETGREETLYIDTDGNAMYYWDGTEYIALSGGGSGGTSNYNELSNKPSINDITLTGNKTSADLGLQPTIYDLATIRSGAASGATAVQPSDMESALSEKQDTISDLQTIRSGAALGATAVQPSDMETALADKQDVISDLDTIRSGATAGNTALQPEDIDTLPTDGSSNPVSSGGTYNFVNSSIATNTAYFIGTFASVAELEAYSGTVTNNDYAFVTSTDSAGNTLYNRYKYNAATLVWSFEYAVNNTAFTTAQWAAIQSGMTPADKTKLDGIETGANKTVIDASPTSGSDNAVSSGGVHTALSGKQDTISDLSDIRSGASAGATAVQPSALNDYQTKLSATNKLDPSYIDYDASHRAVSDTEKSTWNGKQDAISDLDTIRSGAVAGATALQQSDVSSAYSASGTSPVNGTAVNAAIGTLDVSSVGGSGKYISAISETNGKIEATPTTFDTSLSSSSTNNNAPTSKTVFDDQQRQQSQINYAVNTGVKNLLKITGTTASSNGIKYTVNQDGTVTVTGTATANSFFMVGSLSGYTGDIILTGCPANGGYQKWRLFKEGSDPSQSDTGNGMTYTLDGTSVIYMIEIYNGQGFTDANPLIFRPMIRPAAITDSTFQPYALPNPTLTPAVIKAVDEGAKNDFDIENLIKSAFSENATYSLSGYSLTASSNGRYARVSIPYKFKAGTTVFSSVVSEYSKSGGTMYIRFATQSSSVGQIASEIEITGNGQYQREITVNADTDGFVIYYMNGSTNAYVNSAVFTNTMICTAADWAVSQKFVPYAPTNRELYEMIQALKNNS